MEARFTDSDFVTSDGVRLHVLEAGQTDGRPVIAFVPGWSMPASIFRKPLSLLAVDHRVVALDPRGQGTSEVPASGYALERRAEDIAEFVARYPDAVLVAWSLGALESLEYLRVHGEAGVSGLVIVDSSVGEGAPPAAAAASDGGGFQAELRRDRAGAIAAFVRAIFRTPQSEADYADLQEEAMRMPLEASLALFPGSRIPAERWRAGVLGFSKPLLYVVTPQFAAQAERLAAERPATRIELFADAGHALFVDRPERFAALVSDFVSTLPAHKVGR